MTQRNTTNVEKKINRRVTPKNQAKKMDPTSQALQKMSPLESTGLGIAAGVIEVAIDQPQLYWKNAKQQGLPFTLNPR